MLVTSRSFAEYEAMFDLTSLPASVLDCCAGGSGFTAEAARRGVDAVAADPVYELPFQELEEAVRRSAPAAYGIIQDNADRFVWDWYGSVVRRLGAGRFDRSEGTTACPPVRPGKASGATVRAMSAMHSRLASAPDAASRRDPIPPRAPGSARSSGDQPGPALHD